MKWIIAWIAVAVGILITLTLVSGSDQQVWQKRGDVNLDGQVCMDDTMYLVYHLWRDGRELPCMETADVDNDRCIDMMDVIAGLRHIFYGEPIENPAVYCGSGGY